MCRWHEIHSPTYSTVWCVGLLPPRAALRLNQEQICKTSLLERWCAWRTGSGQASLVSSWFPDTGCLCNAPRVYFLCKHHLETGDFCAVERLKISQQFKRSCFPSCPPTAYVGCPPLQLNRPASPTQPRVWWAVAFQNAELPVLPDVSGAHTALSRSLVGTSHCCSLSCWCSEVWVAPRAPCALRCSQWHRERKGAKERQHLASISLARKAGRTVLWSQHIPYGFRKSPDSSCDCVSTDIRS